MDLFTLANAHHVWSAIFCFLALNTTKINKRRHKMQKSIRYVRADKKFNQNFPQNCRWSLFGAAYSKHAWCVYSEVNFTVVSILSHRGNEEMVKSVRVEIENKSKRWWYRFWLSFVRKANEKFWLDFIGFQKYWWKVDETEGYFRKQMKKVAWKQLDDFNCVLVTFWDVFFILSHIFFLSLG